MSLDSSSPPLHFVLFPFMAKGHTIPQLHIARLLSQRGQFVTLFTTPKNSSFISTHLAGTSSVKIHELPFPQNIQQGVPPGVENTEELPNHSKSLFFTFANAAISMQPSFELALGSLRPPVNCIIYDLFLYWVQESADKLRIPTFIFNGMSIAMETLYWLAYVEKSTYWHLPDDEPFSFSSFPSLKLTKNDYDKDNLEEANPENNPSVEFNLKSVGCIFRSCGTLANSFYELEGKFFDHRKSIGLPPHWCIGPLCLAGVNNHPSSSSSSSSSCSNSIEQGVAKPKPWLEWLNKKHASGEHVLYISLGSQAQIPGEELQQIGGGLEQSGVNFLWVLKRSMAGSINEEDFEERVKGRGLIVKEWVDQTEVLKHGSVTGFLSHCGWNSVMEAICAAKPILAFPVMAEQHMNARLVVDEFRIGLRINNIQAAAAAADKYGGGVKTNEVEMKVREFMAGDAGDRARTRVQELSEAAQDAMKEGGSSWSTLNQLIPKVQQYGKFDSVS